MEFISTYFNYLNIVHIYLTRAVFFFIAGEKHFHWKIKSSLKQMRGLRLIFLRIYFYSPGELGEECWCILAQFLQTTDNIRKFGKKSSSWWENENSCSVICELQNICSDTSHPSHSVRKERRFKADSPQNRSTQQHWWKLCWCSQPLSGANECGVRAKTQADGWYLPHC